jgi:hypothetical protein
MLAYENLGPLQYGTEGNGEASSITGVATDRCPKCGNASGDLTAHYYQLPSGVAIADMYGKYNFACVYA